MNKKICIKIKRSYNVLIIESKTNTTDKINNITSICSSHSSLLK